MRTLLAAVLLPLAAACSDRTSAPEPGAPVQRERPLAPDGSTARAITSTPDRVKVQLDLATVRAALSAYRGERNQWPGSIDELKIEGLNYPADLSYDPAAGIVRSRTYPSF